MHEYHDRDWGVPVRDDTKLFELLTLEGAQAGLSWSLILAKREGYRRAFAGFSPERVAAFDDADVARLLGDASIVRNRLKVESTVANARVIDAMHHAGDTLNELLWSFVADETVHNAWTELGALPSATPTSKAMSTALRKRGFRFVGPVTCYSTMQSAGLVNDHVRSCPRWKDLGGAVGSTR
jgi:DNA-3-methyladenine glycosylase I